MCIQIRSINGDRRTRIGLFKRRISHGLALLVIVVAAACKGQPGSTREAAMEASQPNIVFIFADDQTYQTIHALGNETIQTPNLDRLVRDGATFTHAYNMGGWHGAVCVASRTMIISGTHVWRARQKEMRWQEKDSSAMRETWGRLMADRGYDTYMTGKWHVKVPAKEVFNDVKHERPGMPPDAWAKNAKKVMEAINNGGDVDAAMPVGYNRPKNVDDNSWSPYDSAFGGYWTGGKHWSEVVKDDALEFIHTASNKEKPFFMYIAFNAPHDPRQAPQEYLDKYPLENIKVPENFLPEYPWKDSIGVGRSLRDEALAPFPRTEYAVKKHIQEYYALITHLDHQIGQILDALEASGKADNTYIFFTADHGLALGRHGLLGKQNLFDHSIRVPLMVAGPGIPKGKRFDQDVYLQDIMATSLELAGIDKPDYVDFQSFLDIAQGKRAESHYDAIYGCYMHYQRMIRKGGYKLIVYPTISKMLLFDLRNDPGEMKNLADDPAYRHIVKALFADLVKLQESMGDELDLGKVHQAL